MTPWKWKGRSACFHLGVGGGWAAEPTSSGEGFPGGQGVGEGQSPPRRVLVL